MEKPFRIGGEVRRLSLLIKRRIDADPVFTEQNKVTGTHGYMLGFICRKNEAKEVVYQKDIEQAFSIRRSSATEILNTMENNGLIERTPCLEDKRQKRLIVTEKGISTHKTIINRLNAIDGEMKEVLTDEEFNAFKSIITKLEKELLEKEAVWQKQ